MEKLEKLADVGVIVGRFQVSYLHEAHCDLIDTITKWHKKVIIFLGVSPIKCSYNNPLDFEARKQMILERYPDVIVVFIKDVAGDNAWSYDLDEQISLLVGPESSVVLYGGRDSFIRHYSGRYLTQELSSRYVSSGTYERGEIAKQVIATPEFRSGVIWATRNRFYNALPTVDVAIVEHCPDGLGTKRVLLGKKAHDDGYRFIGGFVDTGETMEQAARRETLEETNVDLGELKYIGSYVIDDWRYRGERSKITTTFYMGTAITNDVRPSDDMPEVFWIESENLDSVKIVKEHNQMRLDLVNYLRRGMQWRIS